jgi:hypothetical protein
MCSPQKDRAVGGPFGVHVSRGCLETLHRMRARPAGKMARISSEVGQFQRDMQRPCMTITEMRQTACQTRASCPSRTHPPHHYIFGRHILARLPWSNQADFFAVRRTARQRSAQCHRRRVARRLTGHKHNHYVLVHPTKKTSLKVN